VVRGEDPAAYTFWCILSRKIAPGGNNFYKRPKKKTAVSTKSAGTTFKNLHQQKFPGWGLEFPPRLYVWKKHRRSLCFVSVSHPFIQLTRLILCQNGDRGRWQRAAGGGKGGVTEQYDTDMPTRQTASLAVAAVTTALLIAECALRVFTVND